MMSTPIAAPPLGLAGQSDTELSAIRATSERYRLLGACLEYPDRELVDALAAGELDTLLGLAIRPTGDVEVLQIEYTRLFDAIGGAGSMCSLSAGDYADTRLRVVEEVLRFYDHFGLVPPEQYRVMPDHLTAQLEFLHFLAHAEAELLAQGEDPAAYRRAQRDFLRRQVLSWLPGLVDSLSRHHAAEVFQAVVAILVKTIDAELQRLDDALACALH